MRKDVKKVVKDAVFLERLLKQNRKKSRTQQELAKELDVARSTVAGWFAGTSIPGSLDLKKLAQFYGVSTDYLLGLSDAESPDVTVQAAMEYTGLSEAAVQHLHMGLDDIECDGTKISAEMKKENLRIASALIQSSSFSDIICYLSDIANIAYWERYLGVLDDRYLVSDSPEGEVEFCFANRRDRDVVRTGLIHVFKANDPYWEENIWKHPYYMNDRELYDELGGALMKASSINEMRQFHAAKAFNGYIDQLIAASCKKAEQRFMAE